MGPSDAAEHANKLQECKLPSFEFCIAIPAGSVVLNSRSLQIDGTAVDVK